MGSSWALICSTVLVLVLLSSASNEMDVPDAHMLQREVDWTELFNPEELPQIEQVEVLPQPFIPEIGGSRPGDLGQMGHPPRFGPRSFHGSSIQDYPVQFPLSRPTAKNLQAICLNGDRRPRYSDSYFPASGFSSQRQRAKAVNNLEAWYGKCCEDYQTGDSERTLCCATQAWELSVENFCTEDLSVKHRWYDCCKISGSDRLNCFNSDAPNPNYEPTEEIPLPSLPATESFIFDRLLCQRESMTPQAVRAMRRKGVTSSTSRRVNISFPPGRPSADTIESLCDNQSQRPRYSVKCLPRIGYGWLVRQAKTINRMENGFKRCCKKKGDVLSCADQKWSEELSRFCRVQKAGEDGSQCCSSEGENDRYTCFQNISPDPHYNMTSATEEVSLNKICDTHKIIKNRFPVGFPLKRFVDKCCPLSESDKTVCSAQKIVEMSGTLCSSKRLTPAVLRCCRLPSQETPQCISKIVMDAITKATNVLRQKKKKRCPIS